MAGEKRFRKGFYGEADLPVSDSYVNPQTRNRPLILGSAGALLLALILVAAIWFDEGGLASSGPLSSSHSGLEGECEACHTAFQDVTDEKCLGCHDPQSGEPGIFALENHYASGLSNTDVTVPGENEPRCLDCHREHRGRQASPLPSSDLRCSSCHPFEPFASAHPQFGFLTQKNGPEESPVFSHSVHFEVLETTKEEEPTCFSCHSPAEDGSSFLAIDFAAHCQECHDSEGTLRVLYEGKDLQVLHRADFDHAAHTIQRGCVHCHGETGLLPGIEICRDCHQSGRASDRCTLCHQFHPTVRTSGND